MGLQPTEKKCSLKRLRIDEKNAESLMFSVLSCFRHLKHCKKTACIKMSEKEGGLIESRPIVKKQIGRGSVQNNIVYIMAYIKTES